MTTYEEIRAGFVALALEKNRRATPTVEQARALKVAASQAASPAALIGIPEIQPALVTAAGVSEKAARHMLPQDKAEAVQGLIANFLEPAGAAFVEELTFRFLLTKGDALGGSMRNLGGMLGQRKLTRSTIAALTLAGTPYRWLHSPTNMWVTMTVGDAGEGGNIEYVKGLCWSMEGRRRTMIYNFTVPLLKNNVDICLFDCDDDELGPAVFNNPVRYVTLGELKGGIDPAGADEHWKTANTALSRIREAFSQHEAQPHTFFVAAAVAKKMADEIWHQLEDGTLSNAANLTNADQVASLCRWLVSI